MRKKQLLRPYVMLSLAGTLTVASAQGLLRPCDSLPPGERESAQAIGACRERAPIVDVVPQGIQASVPRVVGLSLDDARSRLGNFTVRRSYVASAEPGGTVLQQQPAPPARLRPGAVVSLVVSDGSLRPAPQVAANEIDGVRTPAEASALPPVSSLKGTRQSVSPTAERSNDVAARRATAAASAAKSTVTPRRSPEQSNSRTGRTKPVQPAPPAAVAQSRAPVIETLELPNVIGRSSADATAALAEFQIDRIEVVANAAPSGQVLAQDPVPGTLVPAGTAIGLQVSDGSLASAPPAAPQVAPQVAAAPAAAPPASAAAATPVRPAMTLPSTAVLLLIAGVLLGLALGALLMRRWLVRRHAAGTEAFVPTVAPPSVERVGAPPPEASTAKVVKPATLPVPAIAATPPRFAARLEEGETKVEFTAPSEADETTLEYSRELHE